MDTDAELLLTDAEVIRQQQELSRQATERTRVAAENARVVAEEHRRTAAQEVSDTVATLKALLERMEAVEAMRRTSRGPAPRE